MRFHFGCLGLAVIREMLQRKTDILFACLSIYIQQQNPASKCTTFVKYCINYSSTVVPKCHFSGSRQYHDRQSIKMIMRGYRVCFCVVASILSIFGLTCVSCIILSGLLSATTRTWQNREIPYVTRQANLCLQAFRHDKF